MITILVALPIFICKFLNSNAQLFEERRPFTSDEKTEFVVEANDLRSIESLSDIQCLRWNTNLEQQAMAYAIQCETDPEYLLPHPDTVLAIDCYFQGIGVAIYTTEIEPYIRDILFDWVIRGDSSYNYSSNTCQSGRQVDCDNYKQFMSSSSNVIGCGRSRCDSVTGPQSSGRPGYVVVCAMPAQGKQSDRPFKQTTSECSGCQNVNANVQCLSYQAGKLCCPLLDNKNDTVCRNKCLGKWNRLFSGKGGDHFYTTSESEKLSAIQKNYRSENETGSILLPIGHELFTDECVKACPKKVALHRLWSRVRKDHMYTTDTNTIRKKNGFWEGKYTEESLSGYVVLRKGECGANVPIHEYVREGLLNSDHFYHTIQQNIPLYKYKGIPFYAWDA